MKKILVLLLFISGLVKSQVVIPKSTTTFSNIVATGNATVNGTLKVNGTSTLSTTTINGTLSAITNSASIGTATANAFNISYPSNKPLVVIGDVDAVNNSTSLYIDDDSRLITAYTNTFNIPNAVLSTQSLTASHSTVTGTSRTGTLTVTSSVTSPTLYGSSSPSGTLNIFSTSSATAGVINIGTSSGTINLNSGTANLTSSTTIGTGTVAANTSSLGILRVKQGSTWMDVGDYGSGYVGLWANQAVNTQTNYAMVTGSLSTEILNTNAIRLNSPYAITMLEVNPNYIYARKLLRVGSTSAPSATLDVTGTMSVSSTATVAGQLNGAAAVFTGNVFAASNLKVGSQAANLATCDISGTFSVAGTSTLTGRTNLTNTLNVLGNTTISSNATATLTTGNTGTIAVLSDAVFPVYLTGGGTNPADGATYYVGGVNVGYLWTANTSQIRLPYNCTLVAWDYNWVATPGSGETATVSINGTTNYTLSSSITYSNAAAAGTFTASGLSQNFNAGDTFNIKTVMPNWVTNPTGLIQGITLWFVRRQ